MSIDRRLGRLEEALKPPPGSEGWIWIIEIWGTDDEGEKCLLDTWDLKTGEHVYHRTNGT